MALEGIESGARESHLHLSPSRQALRRASGRVPPLEGRSNPACRSDVKATDRVDLRSETALRWEKIREARRRMAEGFYERPEVLSAIARRLIDVLAE